MRTDLKPSTENFLSYESATTPVALEIDFQNYFKIVRRRWLSFALTTVLGLAAVAIVARGMQPVYEATAKVLIERQVIAADLVQPNEIERIQVIEQRLMTRDNLLEIVNKLNLYPDVRSRLSPSDIADIMRNSAVITPIEGAHQFSSDNTGAIGFTISFQYNDPDIAARVANELVSLVLQQNIRSRTGRAVQAAKFFQEQSDKLGQDLASLEAQIADFKTKNGASLPDSLPYRHALLLQLQSQQAALDQKIATANQDRPEGQATRVERLNIHLDAERQQLALVNKERESIKGLVDHGIYGKNRLVELDRTAATVQADIDTTLMDIEDAKRHGDPGAANEVGAEAVAKLTAQREQLAQSISDLNSSIFKTPEVEAALETLTRDHDNLQVRYRDAMAKAAGAAIGEDLEESRQAEHFEVVEQATPPTKPVKPNRMKIVLIGSVASGAAGAGMMVAREFFDRRIRTAADIERRMRIRAISVIPYLPVPDEGVKKRRLWSIVLTLVAAAAIAAILALTHFHYLRLDPLISQITTRVRLP
jgi:uncharacterized protein involved in exopolysaccharide biosynthesis